MRDLLRWEMKQTLSSKVFWGMGIAFLLSVFLFLLGYIAEGGHSGFELYLHTMNTFNAFLIFYTGIYAGIHITGAFETRKIQAAVMAGYSRMNILFAKLISFAFSIAVFCMVSVTANSVIGFIAGGIDDVRDDLLTPVIIRGLVFVVVEFGYAAICMILSMLVKNLGGAIAVNFITMLILNIVTEVLIANNIAIDFLRLTPVGQSYMILYDATPQNMMIAVTATVICVISVMTLCYLKLRKEELK